MAEIKRIFKRLKSYHSSNPYLVWAVAWVSLVPSLFSLFTLHYIYSHQAYFNQFQIFSWGFALPYIGLSSLLMGMALLPTTFLSIVSGYLFGWVSLPFLVIGYTLATVIGYGAGKKLDQESLSFLIDNYPKAGILVNEKKEELSWLIFFVRLSPVIPFAFSNILFALLKINLKKVVWIGLWGMLPRTLMAFTTGVLGESLMDALNEDWGIGQYLIILVLLLISGWGIYRFFRVGK